MRSLAVCTANLRPGSFRGTQLRRVAPQVTRVVARSVSSTIRCSAEVENLIEDGAALFNAGDRMSALRRYEEALKKDCTMEQKQEILYASTCVHASFGDLELAKITLREAVVNGLDWDSAVMRSDWVPFTASTQVKIQLRAFAENVQRQLQQQQRQAMSSAASAGSASTPVTPNSRFNPAGFADQIRNVSSQNVEELTGTKMADGMDASVGAIFKRVAILLLVLIVSGIGLFYGGLAVLFPENQGMELRSRQAEVEDF